MRNLKTVVLTNFVYSFSIEICQLFNRRNADIDDLLMNVSGIHLYKIGQINYNCIDNN